MPIGEKHSFFTYGKMTLAALALMEAFVGVAFLIGWGLGGLRFACLILVQGVLFYFWWLGLRRWQAKGGNAQIVQYFDARKNRGGSPGHQGARKTGGS
jgi:hypothetical protein